MLEAQTRFLHMDSQAHLGFCLEKGLIKHSFLLEVFSSMQLTLVTYAAVKLLLFCFTAFPSCSCKCNEFVILWKQVSGRSETLNPWIKIILRSLHAAYQQYVIRAFVCLLLLIIAPACTDYPFEKVRGETNNSDIQQLQNSTLTAAFSPHLPPLTSMLGFWFYPILFLILSGSFSPLTNALGADLHLNITSTSVCIQSNRRD